MPVPQHPLMRAWRHTHELPKQICATSATSQLNEPAIVIAFIAVLLSVPMAFVREHERMLRAVDESVR